MTNPNKYTLKTPIVSFSLSPGDSFTVPSGETWKLYVNYYVRVRDRNYSYLAYASIDGVRCIGYRARSSGNDGAVAQMITEEVIIDENQTFSCTDITSGRMYVSGYVIKGEYYE